MPFPWLTGTRNSPTQSRASAVPPTRSLTQSLSRDPGMSKSVSAPITFSSATQELQAPNGTFAAFGIGDEILVEGTNLNNGLYEVAGVDAANQAYLQVTGGCHDEGPVTATVRAT